jgi:CRP/FNR family transcriptional regulator, polysaccharide utilization system transcription regulator
MINNQNQSVSCSNCAALDQSILKILSNKKPEMLKMVQHGIIFKSHSDLLTQGTQVKGVYCINSGRLKIYKNSESGKEQIIRFAKRGDLLGFRTLIGGHELGVSATTIEDCTVCFVERRDFLKMIQVVPEIKEKLLEDLAEDLAEMVEALTTMAQSSVSSRLCSALLLLDELYDNQGINLSRENLANFVGTAQESIIRKLSEMKNDQLIEISGRKITILDRAAITKTSLFS